MDERMDPHAGKAGRLKALAVLAVLGFAVTLAAIIGNRLSDEALAVLAGAVCGVSAAIPTSLIVVAVSQRQRERERARGFEAEPAWRPPTHHGAYPPVIVVTPQGMQQRFDDWNGLPPSLAAPAQRQFTVVGGTSVEGAPYEHSA